VENIRVRDFSDGDAVAVAVASLLDEIWSHDPVFREIYDIHATASDEPLSRTLVAVRGDESEIVAVCSAQLGLRHPGRLWLAIHVRSDHRRRGIGSALLDELRRRLSDRRPFRVSASLADEESTRFLQTRGFRLVNRCEMGELDAADERVAAELASLRRAAAGIRIEAFRAPLSEATLLTAAAFFAHWYEDTHRWDVPAPWDLGAARDHFCGDVLVEDSLHFGYDGATLIGAAAFIRLPLGTEQAPLYLNQLAVKGDGGTRDRAVAAALLERLLRYAGEPLQPVEFEIDEANTALWAVLHELRIAPRQVIGNFADQV
jgi:GNAT superfamily N-acetyltransferase